jgi:cilia- and flagella-associated protein 57
LLGTGKKDSDLSGILRAYRYPLTGDVAEIQIHKRSITKIVVTEDDSMVFTIGQDGIIAMIELSDTETRAAREKSLMNLPFNGEYLYDKNMYVDKTMKIDELAKKLKETQERTKRINEETQKSKDEEKNELDIRLKKMREVEEERMEKLENETREMEAEFER